MFDELTARIVAFRDKRDWKQFHSPRNLAASISIEAAELLELFQWSSDATLAEDLEAGRGDLERELADVVIYAMLLAHDTGVDLEQAVVAKLAENAEKYPVDRARGSNVKYPALGASTSHVVSLDAHRSNALPVEGDTVEVVNLKVSLKGTKPPVWRRLEVPASLHLGQLHAVINVAMGWLDYHLHEFEIDGALYGIPDDELDWPSGPSPVYPEENVRIGEIARMGIERFVYRYDFGDDWTHTVTVEGFGPAEAGAFYPRCTGGRRNAVPEDCGGTMGFAEFLEAMADPEHPEHHDLRSWYGGDYDPAEFDAIEVSDLLRLAATGELPHQ